MKRVAVLLAEGFEEIEALAPVDLLRRAGVEVFTVGEYVVKGSRNISVVTDKRVSDFLQECESQGLPDAVIIPGGLNGTKNLAACTKAQNFITKMWQENKLVCAICAAPVIVLSPLGILKKKNLLATLLWKMSFQNMLVKTGKKKFLVQHTKKKML